MINNAYSRWTSKLSIDTCGYLFVHIGRAKSRRSPRSFELFANRLNQNSYHPQTIHRCLLRRALHVTVRLFIIRHTTVSSHTHSVCLTAVLPINVRLFGSDFSHPQSAHDLFDQKQTRCTV